MKSEVINLDALRAPSRKVLFLGVEFELGYIPSGASIPVTEGYNRMIEKQMAEMGEIIPEAEAAFKQAHAQEIEQMNIGFVADFCSFWDPSFTIERISKEATTIMVDGFFTEIIRAIMTNAAQGVKSLGGRGSDGSKKNETGGKP
jgi:hypothetical protein